MVAENDAEVCATDYHTAGEPFRIVTAGVPEIPGATVRERREHASRSSDVDAVRRLLCHEPRGHADMYGCFLVSPDDDGAHLGVLFWHTRTATRPPAGTARSRSGRGRWIPAGSRPPWTATPMSSLTCPPAE